MSYIPDCRTDENYNVEALNETDKSEIRGYDYCAETIVPGFFDNLITYFEPDSYIMHILNQKVPVNNESWEDDEEDEEAKIETYWDLIREKLLDWIEMGRDEIITSMIDNYAE